ncbi:YxeA family protein [Bacillus sp. CDB3]|uniref:YxeA family protein n=1 Tax=Bacillus sp. CDB3 TaxID=360310 RepID=UPI0009D85C2F|nr:YxeA family protein [Bacillus sp. CDB3]OQR53488.1 hypothetical protein CDB3_29490 [Bacillus sp. CDB3]
MKRYITLFSLVLILSVTALGCQSIKRMGTHPYYVQITTDGQLKDKRFEYNLQGFDEEGKEKTMSFTAEKQLRKDAYLKLFYDGDKGVKTWEEVKNEDLPKKVKEKMQGK